MKTRTNHKINYSVAERKMLRQIKAFHDKQHRLRQQWLELDMKKGILQRKFDEIIVSSRSSRTNPIRIKEYGGGVRCITKKLH